MPISSAKRTTSRISCMVVVSREEQAMMPQFWCSAASTNFSGATSTPRSTTSMPLPSIMIFTRFLPMSCISPRTVPRQTRPTVSLLSPAMCGLSSSVAAAMQRAAMSISGTKARLAEKSSPSRFMPRTSPSVRICCASCPASSASVHSCSTRFCCPRTSAAAMRANTSPCGCSGSDAGAACAAAACTLRRGTGGRCISGTCSAALYSSTA